MSIRITMLLSTLCVSVAVGRADSGKPNIVFIIADDLGWAGRLLFTAAMLQRRTSTSWPARGSNSRGTTSRRFAVQLARDS